MLSKLLQTAAGVSEVYHQINPSSTCISLVCGFNYTPCAVMISCPLEHQHFCISSPSNLFCILVAWVHSAVEHGSEGSYFTVLPLSWKWGFTRRHLPRVIKMWFLRCYHDGFGVVRSHFTHIVWPWLLDSFSLAWGWTTCHWVPIIFPYSSSSCKPVCIYSKYLVRVESVLWNQWVCIKFKDLLLQWLPVSALTACTDVPMKVSCGLCFLIYAHIWFRF